MKKFLFSVAGLAALLLFSCSKDNGSATLIADFTMTPNPASAGQEVTFTPSVTGGEAPYSYSWSAVARGAQDPLFTSADERCAYTFEANGTYSVTFIVTDAAGTSVQRQKNLVVNPAEVEQTGDLTLKWVAPMGGYVTGSAPAVYEEGDIVYAVCGTPDNNLYAVNAADGSVIWSKAVISSTSDSVKGIPSVDEDGNVYVLGGDNNGTGVFVSYTPDGDLRWSFNEWWAANDAVPVPNAQGVIPALDGENAYIGNTGTSGTIIAVSQADGSRVNFCKNAEGSGPAGGARNGIVISNTGVLCWFGGVYSLFGLSQTEMDKSGEGVAPMWWKQSDWGDATSNTTGGLAMATISGKSCVCGTFPQNGSTILFAVECSTGDEVLKYTIPDSGSQDGGGISVTEDGYLVVGLNYTLGQDNGGILVYDPVNQKEVARYRIQEKVAGTPAVDKAGNIHFATEEGSYYIVKLEGDSFELLVNKDIAELITSDPRYSSDFSRVTIAKMWSSPVIADDGTVYISFTDDAVRTIAGVIALAYEGTDAPADSEWPMLGQNARHTSVQPE